MTETVYHVTWPWLAFPVALVVLVAAILVGVIIESRKAGLDAWKNSSIDAFTHGPDDEARRLLMRSGTSPFEVEQAAKKI